MFFRNAIRMMLRHATPILPAILPVSARPSATVGRVYSEESTNQAHLLQGWSPSSSSSTSIGTSLQPLSIRNGSAAVTPGRSTRRSTLPNSNAIVTHDENGPLGLAQEKDFLGTIWVRTSQSVVRRSARIRHLKLAL